MFVPEIPKQQRAAIRVVGDPAKVVNLQTINVPSLGPSQILIRITWTGICGTDKSYLLDELDAITGGDLGSNGSLATKASDVKPGQWIVITGAGGGIGHLAVQYAKAMGLRVIAIDTGDQKRRLCEKLGAEAFVDFKTSGDITTEIQQLTKLGAHGVLVIAPSQQAFSTAPGFLRPGSTVAAVGVPTDTTIIAGAPPSQLISGQLKIVGSLVGSREDVEEAFEFAARGLIHPVVCKGKLAELDSWIRKLQTGDVAGRIVLQVW